MVVLPLPMMIPPDDVGVGGVLRCDGGGVGDVPVLLLGGFGGVGDAEALTALRCSAAAAALCIAAAAMTFLSGCGAFGAGGSGTYWPSLVLWRINSPVTGSISVRALGCGNISATGAFASSAVGLDFSFALSASEAVSFGRVI